LKERLLKAQVEESVIEEVISELLSLGYLDDEAFALNVVRSEMRRKKSRLQAFLKLKNLRVEEGLAKKVLAENYKEEESLLALIEKGIKVNQPPQKMIASLMRKGFSYEEISKFL
jgi:SOS response regulatory protein OraA/RecX